MKNHAHAVHTLVRATLVRPYEQGDIPQIVDMLVRSIPTLPNYATITPDPYKIEYTLRHGVTNGVAFGGWVLCDSHQDIKGCIGAWCVPSIMSDDLIADDIFMWIEPEHRSFIGASLLVQAYINWAMRLGATLIRASHTGGSWDKSSREFALFDLLLKRLGFNDVGSVYHLNKS